MNGTHYCEVCKIPISQNRVYCEKHKKTCARDCIYRKICGTKLGILKCSRTVNRYGKHLGKHHGHKNEKEIVNWEQ
jgi:hypothetical protein